MDAYEVCRGCACFIKRAEARCPFCGAEHVAAAASPRRIPRVSRAQWLAVASALTVTGCSGAVAPTTTSSSGEQGKDHDAASAQPGEDSGSGGTHDASVADARHDAAIPEAGHDAIADAGLPEVGSDASASCTAALQPFECGTTNCNPATDFCYLPNLGAPICEANDAGYPFPSQCASCPTCECISPYVTGACHCVELDAGGVGIQCAGCYGAPPTRLELLA